MKKAKVKNNYLKEIILILLFILFIILSFLCFRKSIIIQREQNVFYEEIGSPNYKIYLKDNNYYKQDYLDKDMSYIANLIDNISINYNYKFISDTELNGEYYYKIVANLEIRNPKNNSLFYQEKYELSEEKKFPIKNEKEYVINETIDIKYDNYNAIANNFEASYGVDTESNLTVSLELHRKVDGTLASNSDINSDNKINLIIPLSEKTINLKTEPLAIKNKNVVISLNQYKIDDIKYLIGALLFLGFAVTIFIYITKKTISLRPKLNSYDKILRKILRQYGQLTQETMEKALTSGDENIIATLKDSNTFLEKAIQLQDQYRQKKEETKNAIIDQAYAEVEANGQSLNSINEVTQAYEETTNDCSAEHCACLGCCGAR